MDNPLTKSAVIPFAAHHLLLEVECLALLCVMMISLDFHFSSTFFPFTDITSLSLSLSPAYSANFGIWFFFHLIVYHHPSSYRKNIKRVKRNTEI